MSAKKVKIERGRVKPRHPDVRKTSLAVTPTSVAQRAEKRTKNFSLRPSMNHQLTMKIAELTVSLKRRVTYSEFLEMALKPALELDAAECGRRLAR